MKAILIDNYDSFTYNLKAQLQTVGFKVDVVRNDKVQINNLQRYDLIVFSPGPGVPEEAGSLMEIIERYKFEKPMFGVCLGMQAIAQVFGGELNLLDTPLHGVSRTVEHKGDDIFKGIPTRFEAARYHSWVVSNRNLPQELEVIAFSQSDELMAIKHKLFPVYGVQFHPESILTDIGDQIIKNLLNLIKIKQNEKVIREII